MARYSMWSGSASMMSSALRSRSSAGTKAMPARRLPCIVTRSDCARELRCMLSSTRVSVAPMMPISTTTTSSSMSEKPR